MMKQTDIRIIEYGFSLAYFSALWRTRRWMGFDASRVKSVEHFSTSWLGFYVLGSKAVGS